MQKLDEPPPLAFGSRNNIGVKRAKPSSASRALAACAPHAAAGRRVSSASVFVDVNGRRVPIPEQALYAAASALRLSTEGYGDWRDCAAVVALVLSAMERDGVL